MKLAVPPFLGPFVAEHGADEEVLFDPRALLQAVFQKGPDHLGGGLRPHGHRIPMPVRERIHLFGHDVGVRADGTGEELGALQHGQTHLPVAVEVENLPGHPLHPLPAAGLRRQDVFHAAHGANRSHS